VSAPRLLQATVVVLAGALDVSLAELFAKAEKRL
jgi:hypothetical protein